MSNSFLQRFKGKTHTLNQEGVTTILGTKQPQFQQNQNHNHNQNHHLKNSHASFEPVRMEKKFPRILPKSEDAKKSRLIVGESRIHRALNPFLESNPFYLDEEERQRDELRRERMRVEVEKLKAREREREGGREGENGKDCLSPRRGKLEKKWVKLGGLGANIGGQEWLERKKKRDKMQEFSGVVKNNNSSRMKQVEFDANQPPPKYPNSRDRALEYSRHVGRPRRQQEVENSCLAGEASRVSADEEISELQLYEERHERLKRVIERL